MRFVFWMAMLAVCLITLQYTASGTEHDDGNTLPAADAQSAPVAGTLSQGSTSDPPAKSGDLTDTDGVPPAKPETTTTTTNQASAATADKTTEDEPGAQKEGGPQPGTNSEPLTITQDAGTNRQTQPQPQLPLTDTDQRETEGRSTPAHDDKKPTLAVEPPVSQAATETTTIAPARATLAGAADPERPHEGVLADNTLTIGGATQQQSDRLGQPQPNTAPTTGIQTRTQLAQQITPQNPQLNPAGTKPVSAHPPQPTPITRDNALDKTTDQQLSLPATLSQQQNPVTGQKPPTNAAAAANPVTTKETTSTNRPARHGHNPATTNSGEKNKIHALKLKTTTSTATPKDSPQTSLTSTTESAKEEYTAPANPLPKLSKTLQHMDIKDGSIGSSLLSALTALVTLTVMAVAPVL